MTRCRTFAVAVFLAVATTTASAQFPPASIYRLVDAGEVPVPGACSCISDPFKVPQFVPDAPTGGGATSPFETDPPSAAARRYFAQQPSESAADLAASARAGLAGSPGDSFGMAMYLGFREFLGTSTPELEEQASRWLHLAAQQEHHDAYVRLAYRYRHGRGAPQDEGAAAYWTHEGATRNDFVAMIAMGLTYASGRGVPQDWGAAVEWWRRAEPNHPLAARFIGDAYVCGLGVERDLDRAVIAYKDAAKRGEASASIRLGDLYAGGCVSGREEAAVEAYTVAADLGYPEAQVALSQLLLEGRGTRSDPYTAYRYARVAELRLPEGELKTLAAQRARAAAAFLSDFWIADADRFIEAWLAATSR